jgi:hypothetical protein
MKIFPFYKKYKNTNISLNISYHNLQTKDENTRQVYVKELAVP